MPTQDTRRRRTTRRPRAATPASLALAACCGGGGFDNSSGSGATQPPASGPVTITFMITSNGPADVKLQQDTVKAWETKTGNKVEVVAASDINQQLSQGFAAGSPPDVFFTDANVFPTYAKAGNMLRLRRPARHEGRLLPDGLVKTFTYDNKFYCAPKDFSTLALVVNTDLWTKRRADRRRRPQDLGRPRDGRQEADDRTRSRASSSATRVTASAPS